MDGERGRVNGGSGDLAIGSSESQRGSLTPHLPRLRSGQRQKSGEARHLDIQPNRPHQSQTITLGDHTFTQLVIEMHSPISELFLEMEVRKPTSYSPVHLSEGQVVCTDETYCSSVHQRAYHAFSANKPILRVCSLQEFVQQE